MNPDFRPKQDFSEKCYEQAILSNINTNPYRITPFIVTLCEEDITSIDINNFLQVGLRVVRFRIQNLSSQEHLIAMINTINKGLKEFCAKYNVSTWPISLALDIPNACVNTGFLKKRLKTTTVELKEDTLVKITSDTKFMKLCDKNLICINDSYILTEVVVGTEISVHFGRIVLICTSVIDGKNIECKVIRGGPMGSTEFIHFRGVTHRKPPLSQFDLSLIQFGIQHRMDVIIINSVRRPDTVMLVRKMMPKGYNPLIISTICESEALSNIEEIIDKSDAIILAREFLAFEIEDKYKMITIQMHVSGKCKEYGKPCYISGNILEETLLKGSLINSDLSDITNAVIQGYGFVLRTYKNLSNLMLTIKILEDMCRTVESFAMVPDLWRMIDEYKMPANAAESCIVACAIAAKQTNSIAFIVPTVTGYTAKQLSHITPGSIIFSVSTNPDVARQLLLYRGIFPLVYEKPTNKDFYIEMKNRINVAVSYGFKNDILKYGQTYIVLCKSTPYSSFADSIRIWKVGASKNSQI